VHVAQFVPQATHAVPEVGYSNPALHAVHKTTVVPVQVPQFAAQATQTAFEMKKPLLQEVQTVIDVHVMHYAEH